jgi:acyl-CoA thioesterase
MDAARSTNFSDMLGSLEQYANHLTIALPSDWLQGRTAYGGLSAALCLEATRRTYPDLPPLRSAQFSFVGPASGILRVTATMLRRGKSAAFASADLEGEGGLAARATFCFGAERALSFSFANVPMPTGLSADDCPAYFDWPHKPNFMNHFEGRLVSGARPETPDASPEMLVWLSHRDKKVDVGYVGLLALADALPPAATILFPEPAPISTMTWSVDMLDAAPTSASGWWLVQCAAETARHGYSAQSTLIWSPDGRPILAARQNIAIFAKR